MSSKIWVYWEKHLKIKTRAWRFGGVWVGGKKCFWYTDRNRTDIHKYTYICIFILYA